MPCPYYITLRRAHTCSLDSEFMKLFQQNPATRENLNSRNLVLYSSTAIYIGCESGLLTDSQANFVLRLSQIMYNQKPWGKAIHKLSSVVPREYYVRFITIFLTLSILVR